MIKKITLVLLFFYTCLGAKINFDSHVHHFGSIYESEGNVTHTFKFTNKGDKPVKIIDLNAP